MSKDNILDFTDYAKPLDFKFKEDTYRIPAFSKNQIEKLMEINKKFTDFDDPEKIVPDAETELSKEKLNQSNDYFNMQDDFIACALFKKEGEEFKPVDIKELIDWPVKVKNRVMKAISEQMSATIEDDEPEKKS